MDDHIEWFYPIQEKVREPFGGELTQLKAQSRPCPQLYGLTLIYITLLVYSVSQITHIAQDNKRMLHLWAGKTVMQLFIFFEIRQVK